MLHTFWFDSQPGEVLSFAVGDHFILGDKLPRTRSTIMRAINSLKEIVSNRRLDRSLFMLLISANRFHLIALTFFFSVLFASVLFCLFTNYFSIVILIYV